MSLEAHVRLTLGTLELDVALDVRPGELVALLGPNGAGKSTILRCIAGLLPLEQGHVRIDGRLVDDPDAGTFVPTEERAVGMVFQDYLLFPTMTALENVAFGLRARGMDRRVARRAAGEWLARVGLADQAGDRPRQLSGGQAQRVALARALAADPAVLLLDEPLAALDASARSAVRRDLRAHLDGFAGTRLMVTHDPVDAYALADRVVVVEEGRVVQHGTIAEVTAHPRSRYVAELVGLNLVEGVMRASTLHVPSGGEVVVAGAVADGPALVVIRPQAVGLHRTRPEGSARNAWALRVEDLDERPDRTRVSLAGALSLVAEITPGAVRDLDLRPGDDVWATVKATDITASPA